MKSVAINGYGTIGKRVADAVAAQDDMKVIGVSKTRPNYEARTAVEEKGYDLYIGIPERANQFKEAGIEIAGTVEDMIQEADVVVDCTPGTIGPQNLEMYKKAGVKVARYHMVDTIENAKKFILEVGYPVVVKPDNGVGANATYKI